MEKPAHIPAAAAGHVVIAAGLCLSLLVMLPLVAGPVARLLVPRVLALFGA